MATLTSLTRKDLEKLQSEYPDYPMELVDGNIYYWKAYTNGRCFTITIAQFTGVENAYI